MRPLFAAAALVAFTGSAFALPGGQDAGNSSPAHSATAAHVTEGAIAAGGTAAGVAGLSSLFSDKGAPVNVAHAPEMSSSGSIGGLTLLIGGLLIANSRRRARE